MGVLEKIINLLEHDIRSILLVIRKYHLAQKMGQVVEKLQHMQIIRICIKTNQQSLF